MVGTANVAGVHGGTLIRAGVRGAGKQRWCRRLSAAPRSIPGTQRRFPQHPTAGVVRLSQPRPSRSPPLSVRSQVPVFRPVVEEVTEERNVGGRVRPGCRCVHEPIDLPRTRHRVGSDRFVTEFEAGAGTQYHRRPEIPRVVAQALGSGFVGQYFIPCVTEVPDDCLRDLTGIGSALLRMRTPGLEEMHSPGSPSPDGRCPAGVLRRDFVAPQPSRESWSPPPGSMVGWFSVMGASKRGATSELTCRRRQRRRPCWKALRPRSRRPGAE